MKPAGAIRKGNYKLIEWYEASLSNNPKSWELYNLENDISETHNLADSLPGLKIQLTKELSEWRASVSAQMPIRRQEQLNNKSIKNE